MSRRTHESASSPISLFPFLAVLICTMGVMIILLVVAHKAGEAHGEEVGVQARQEWSKQKEQLDFELESNELKIQVLIKSLPELRKQLEQARLRRGHVENELRELEKRFDEVAARARQLEQPIAQPTENEALELQALQKQLEEAERDLRETLAQGEAKPKSYSIVTHPSIHGTFRRPIYIECTATSIILQPHGVEIQTAELIPPVLPGNPLDTALLAIREYWMKYDLAGDAGEPYPLLVIRPDGAQSYALARQAMQNWNDEFGYELIEVEKNIDFGAVDPQLSKILNAALPTARAQYAEIRRLAMLTAQPEVTDRQRNEGLRVSHNGGFEMIADPIRVADVSNEPIENSTTPKKGEQTVNDQQVATAPGAVKPQGPPQAQMNEASGDSDTVVPLAKTRGANWALPSKNVSATGYRRPIVVHCGANSLAIDGGHSSLRKEVDIRLDTESVDRFITAIWQVIESWGIAERNGFWKPELQFVVAPDGRETFERLQTMLEGCGFEIRRITLR